MSNESNPILVSIDIDDLTDVVGNLGVDVVSWNPSSVSSALSSAAYNPNTCPAVPATALSTCRHLGAPLEGRAVVINRVVCH
ncbi:MAG: hypothetical protein V4739_06585 [Pseudomonadota bacterium]